MKKVLIANRGEIARRIIRTCHRLGVETVAVYSDVDARSPHVTEATEAFRLPGLTPAETYLRSDLILEIARSSGADALHPGYGFLSENGDFARACAERGITFVGPSPEAIDHLGSKTNARALAISAGVPVMPGTTSGVASLEEARSTADEIGYPVLLKAAAGGGGKGMRVVASADDLESGLRAAQGEARTAFGDDEVFVEKYVTDPRHIEIQVVADTHGNVLILGERECSIQRRHQKLIEESPSIALDEKTRQAMFEAASQLVAAANYTNAGTLEFLLASDGSFYFLEVNTRLQVEHPVTELVTGLDLVELQILVARGEKLPLSQSEVSFNGHAIECRICAEDSYDGFLPSVGWITSLHEPEGEGVRVDSSLFEGMEVSLYYDPMIGKLITYGGDRSEAIGRMLRALDSYHIAGVKTTIPFCRSVLQNDEFIRGDFSTGYVAKHWVDPVPSFDSERLAVAIKAAVRTREEIERRRRSAADLPGPDMTGEAIR